MWTCPKENHPHLKHTPKKSPPSKKDESNHTLKLAKHNKDKEEHHHAPIHVDVQKDQCYLPFTYVYFTSFQSGYPVSIFSDESVCDAGARSSSSTISPVNR